MIYGYSERGIFNSIIYYLDLEENQNLIGDFLKVLEIEETFSCKTHSFTFLNEQSFSDFGDSDLTIIIKEKDTEKKTVVFIEGKVKTFNGNYSLHKEFEKVKNSIDKEQTFDGFSSTIFIQMYFKYLLSKGNDEEVIDTRLNKVINRHVRKIGKNKVVICTRNKYIKDATYYFVAIIPKQKEDSQTNQEKNCKSEILQKYFDELKLMQNVKDKIRCAFWEDIFDFFDQEKFKVKNGNNIVIENFRHNKNQIYKTE